MLNRVHPLPAIFYVAKGMAAINQLVVTAEKKKNICILQIL